MRALPIKPVADAPSFVKGVSLIRATPTAVLDAGDLLGGAAGSGGRLVRMKVGERTVALAVDSVLGVRELDANALSPLPGLLRGGRADAISELGVLDAELCVVLDSIRVLPDELLARLEAEPGATP